MSWFENGIATRWLTAMALAACGGVGCHSFAGGPSPASASPLSSTTGEPQVSVAVEVGTAPSSPVVSPVVASAIVAPAAAHVLRAKFLAAFGDNRGAGRLLRLARLHDESSPWLREQISRNWLARGRSDAARLEVDEALKEAPDHLGLLMWAAQLSLWLGDGDRALDNLNRLKSIKASNVPSYLFVEAHLWRGDIGAAKSVAAAPDRQPDADELWQMAGRFEDFGELTTALALYQRVSALRPTEPDALMAQVRVARLDQKHRVALEALTAFKSLYPDSVEADVEWVRILVADGQRSKADAKLRHLELTTNSDAALSEIVAELWFEVGNLARGQRILRRLLDDDSTNDVARWHLMTILQSRQGVAECLRLTKGFRQQRERLRAVLFCRRYGDDAANFLLAGAKATVNADDVLATLQDAVVGLARLVPATAASTTLERWLRKVDDPAVAARTRILLAELVGDTANALLWASRLVKIAPDRISAHNVWAEVQSRYSDAAVAIKKLRSLYFENLGDASASNALGFTLLEHEGPTLQAEVLIRRAYRLSSNVDYIKDSLGWLLLKQGQPTRANSILFALANRVDDPEVLWHCGMAMMASRRFDIAHDVLVRARGRAVRPALKQAIDEALAKLKRTKTGS